MCLYILYISLVFLWNFENKSVLFCSVLKQTLKAFTGLSETDGVVNFLNSGGGYCSFNYNFFKICNVTNIKLYHSWPVTTLPTADSWYRKPSHLFSLQRRVARYMPFVRL